MKKFLPVLVVLGSVAAMAVIAMDYFRPPGKEPEWTTDYQKAFAQAKAENKMVMIDFSGISWCLPCQALHKQVFMTPKFQDYVQKKFILVKVDFPTPTELPKLGEELIQKYLPPIEQIALPTVVIVAPDGKALGQTGYQHGGPEPFIVAVEKIVGK